MVSALWEYAIGFPFFGRCIIRLILFIIPAAVFGILAGTNSPWWLLCFCAWEFVLGERYADMVNDGTYFGSVGVGVRLLDAAALIVCFGLSMIFLPHFSLFS